MQQPNDDVALHPIAAALAAAIVSSDSGVSLPLAAVEQARKDLRQADDVAVSHVVALGVKVMRVAGQRAAPVLTALAALIVEKLGSQQQTADRFAAAGLQDAAAVVGRAVEVRAPREGEIRVAAPPAVKARRGLSRTAKEPNP